MTLVAPDILAQRIRPPGSDLATLHVWKVYADSADDAVFVVAADHIEAGKIALRSGLKFDLRRVDGLIVRYVLSRSGPWITPGITEEPR